MDYQRAKRTGVIRLDKEDLSDPGTMKVVRTLMHRQFEQMDEAAEIIAHLYNISLAFACCILYLRSRSRWSEEFEARLVQMAHNDEPVPNMNEWPEDYFKGKV